MEVIKPSYSSHKPPSKVISMCSSMEIGDPIAAKNQQFFWCQEDMR